MDRDTLKHIGAFTTALVIAAGFCAFAWWINVDQRERQARCAHLEAQYEYSLYQTCINQ